MLWQIYDELRRPANIDGYMKWAVQGAVAFYQADKNIPLPKTVREETNEEAEDKNELLRSFVEDHLMLEMGSFISTEEIREAFLASAHFTTQYTDEREMSIWLKGWLDSTPPTEGREILIPGVKWSKRQFPSRQPGAAQRRGYANLAWYHINAMLPLSLMLQMQADCVMEQEAERQARCCGEPHQG